jgi:hypothetical protein
MSAPRTCGAKFSSTAELAQATTSTIRGSRIGPPPPPGGSGNSQTASASTTTTTARGSVTAPGNASTNPQGASGQPATAGGGRTGPPTVTQQTATPPKDVPVPQTDEQFAKDRIQELLTAYCAAFEAMDPVAVQKLFPKVNEQALKIQLNTSKYRSVQCKLENPAFQGLDPQAGTARVRTELKQVFEHTILTEKPQKSELIATFDLLRGQDTRSPWLIKAIEFKPKQ